MAEPSSNMSILIPDSQDHKPLVLQVIHCLSLQSNITIYVMSSDKVNYLRYSRYVKHFSYYPYINDENWINNIESEVEKYGIDVILPVFEIGIKKIIQNKDRFRRIDKVSILPNLSSFMTAGDKGLLYYYLENNGFSCPKSVVTKPNEFPDLKELEFPLIAKPVIGFGGGQEIRVLKNDDDVLEYSKRYKNSCNAIYQNFIKGYDLCCNVLCDKGVLKAYSIQDARVSKEGSLAPQTGFRFIEELEVIQITKKLMKSLDWSGVANIDFRYDNKDGSFKIIEINTRYWMNVEASAIAALNFPYLHCLVSLNKKHDLIEAKNIVYLNLKGLVSQIAKSPSTIFKIGFLKNNTPLFFAFKDPIPMIYRFVWRTKNKIISRIK